MQCNASLCRLMTESRQKLSWLALNAPSNQLISVNQQSGLNFLSCVEVFSAFEYAQESVAFSPQELQWFCRLLKHSRQSKLSKSDPMIFWCVQSDFVLSWNYIQHSLIISTYFDVFLKYFFDIHCCLAPFSFTISVFTWEAGLRPEAAKFLLLPRLRWELQWLSSNLLKEAVVDYGCLNIQYSYNSQYI